MVPKALFSSDFKILLLKSNKFHVKELTLIELISYSTSY